jgi:hypothetical protein
VHSGRTFLTFGRKIFPPSSSILKIGRNAVEPGTPSSTCRWKLLLLSTLMTGYDALESDRLEETKVAYTASQPRIRPVVMRAFFCDLSLPL